MRPLYLLQLTLAILLAATFLGCTSPQDERVSQPNIIFIISDDQGWGDIGYHGSEILTPNLDHLAQTGARLEQHYVNPVCSPTRAALLTGLYPSRYGVLGAIAGTSTQCVPPDSTTIPALLGEAGYRTHISGKWHLALRRELGPTKYGFETSYGYLHGQIDPYTHRYKFGDRTWHRNEELIEEEGHATDLITQEAIRFIESKDEQPFFLYVAYSVPHYPLAEPDEWTEMYEEKIEERSRRLFAASLTHMDAGIGQIVEALDLTGLRDNTLLVYSSDNGGQESWMNTSDQYEGRFPPDPVLGNNLPLRGWKGDVYEGGIRVPAFANWPGTITPSQIEVPMHIVDWLPTFSRLAGCAGVLPEGLDGVDMWPTVSGAIKTGVERSIYVKAASGASLRFGDWKIVESSEGRTELFNLETDPEETKDLAEDETLHLEKLLQMLRQEQAKDGEPVYCE